MFTDRPTEISPQVAYWFWLGVFSLEAFGVVLLVAVVEGISVEVSWAVAIAVGAAAGVGYYASTAEARTAAQREVRPD